MFQSKLIHSDDADVKFNRISGISFAHGDGLKEWAAKLEEAYKNDHRKIGREQDLFFFHESSPGSCFFQPKGAHIYNTLQNIIRNEYSKRGFQEVITPNIFKTDLWKTSGHWDHYAEHIYRIQTDKDQFALKPMNCPSHCLIFAHKIRSYRELPIRYADFGVLHRDEPSGGLTGLTRVRRFQQDDAHIFCSTEQIQSEIDSSLEFLSHVYGIFGFEFNLVLSTRPDSYLGDLNVWQQAETALENSLNKFGKPWKLNAKDGAFYGPKIDITITDALKRAHQCGTIQLDFMLPDRFELTYDAEGDVKRTPVIIHRALLGSLERFIAILTEHFKGRLPFFLSPNQIKIVPVVSIFNEYAETIQKKISDAKFRVEVDLDQRTKFAKKIRNAQVAQFNYILVVGEKEVSSNTINVRTRDGLIHGQYELDDLINRLNKVRDEFRLDDKNF